MRLYKSSLSYLEYLHSYDDKVILSDSLIGIPIRLNELIYFVPIYAIDNTDYDNNELRKSSPTIMRMYDIKKNEYYGKCLLSNMFSIPYKELIPVDLTNYDKETVIILEKKIEYIRKNISRIEKAAKRLYKQKIKGYKQSYLNSTLNFSMTERLSMKWELDYYGKHYNRFPDYQFFLTNPFVDGVTEYYLMNKNIRIARVLMNNVNQNVIEIKEVIHKEYAPIECFKNNELNAVEVTNWFKGRGIPSWRDGLDDFLDNLGIENKDILLNKAYGLSLSDQYWMNPVDRLLNWDDINFFNNDFNSQDYLIASFDNKLVNYHPIDFYSPNNTSDGMLKKAWIIGENKKRYLLKGLFKQKELEPFNEILAGMICEIIQLDYIPYTIEIYNNVLLSKCECFINKDTELISAYAVLKYNNINMDINYIDMYNQYISILENQGIKNAREKIQKMFILDYLIVNQDRHLGNFGIIRNVENLKWMDIAPNFDSGQSMYSQNEIYEYDFNQAYGCFFNHKNINFDIILDIVLCDAIIDVDFGTLKKIPQQWEELLKSYQYISMITDEKIKCLIKGIYMRIEKLESILQRD
jgi:hypothetical protein